MKPTHYKLDIERLIALLFVFVLSCSSFFVRLMFPISNKIVNQVLFYFGFFGCGFVVLSIIFYYISKANVWLNSDRRRLIVTIAIFLAVGHASFIGIGEMSWWKFLSYLAGDGVVIAIGLLTYKKWGNKKPNSKKLI